MRRKRRGLIRDKATRRNRENDEDDNDNKKARSVETGTKST
jgi:hypothetical protein